MQYQKLDNWQNIPQLKSLRGLSTPPKELYFIGKWDPNIFKNCSAVVGSRKMTDYGARVVEKIIPSLVMQGKTVVSGFMYGVDQHVHKVCVENGGKTIAVLGWGIDTPISGSDLALAKKIIASGGILLSGWETLKAAHWTFPARNRIVAALSSEVFVVEAAQKSGSLITAAIAVKLKRKLWTVPGPITSRISRGTNQLIASGKAEVWLGEPAQMSFIQTDDPVLQILQDEALTADRRPEPIFPCCCCPAKSWKKEENTTYQMLIKIRSIANIGLETVPIDVEVDVATAGFPGFTIVGLASKAIWRMALWKLSVSQDM